MKIQIVVFSKDRALQLQAALESFVLHCSDSGEALIRVLYTTSSARHERQYLHLRKLFPKVQFVLETDFQIQTLRIIADCPYVFFMVDDNIFFKPFSLTEIVESIESQPDSIGFSLRLGRNTTYCHTRDISQAVPVLEPAGGRVLRAEWQGAEGNFGYPLELSSSVYRTSHMLALLQNISFSNPNLLESEMSIRTGDFDRFSYLLFFEHSVTFSNPVNRVQDIFENRIAGDDAVEADELADMFDLGRKIDVKAYLDVVPNAAHFEMPLIFVSDKGTPLGNVFVPPLISVVIPTYNGEDFLSDAVESIAKQNYENVEIIIVNDGSTDGSSELANDLARKNPELRIRVIDKENEGLAAARNDGIKAASGEWILPLDCDDCFGSGFLDQAVKVMESKPEVNLIFANMGEFGASQGEWVPAEYSIKTVMKKNTFPYGSLYRRELWEYTGGYELSTPWGSQDWLFWIAASTYGLKVYRIEDRLFRYRTHADGSMYTQTMKRFDDVKLCLRNLLPSIYSAAQLLNEQKAVETMHPDTFARIAARAELMPQLAMLHLWNGLKAENDGDLAEALAGYTRAMALSQYKQWLPYLRLFLLNLKLGRKDAALKNALAVVEHRPELAQAFRGVPGIDLVSILPLNVAVASNIPHWQMMHEHNYFEKNKKYVDERHQLKDSGDDLKLISRYVKLEKNMKAGVIGCGYGRESAMLSPFVEHVYGVDVSSRILDKCLRRLRSKGVLNFTAIQAPVWKHKLPAGLDFVYCFDVFQYITRDLVEDYLYGIGRKLATGGRILCQFAELPEGTDDARLEIYEPNVKWTCPQIEGLAQKVGLELLQLESVEVESGGFWHWAFMKRRED